jgi:mannose-1-phosphate guanylyltransferase/mannose-6-phosphate isomerase
MVQARRIYPVLLSGGAGSRLWPMSRELYPKQLLNLCSDNSMLQDTALRVADPLAFAPPLVVCNEEHRFIIAEQLRQIGCTPRAIVLEPVGRNTAPACALAALLTLEEDPDALLLLLPADHLIRDLPAFLAAVDIAATAAAQGHLATFGITPTGPETGYGYIRRGPALGGIAGAYSVDRFVEKPSQAVAETYVAGGDYAWNSGMFLFGAAQVVAELDRHAPAVLAACRAALDGRRRDLDFLRLDAAAFGACPNISIDYALMEPTAAAAVVPCDLGWTDVGAWSALWEVGPRDAAGNVLIGDVVTEAVRDSYIRSDHHLTAVVGVSDMVVVVTDDAVLVTSRERAQDVKLVVDRLKKAGRAEPVTHRQVRRPWGSYQGIYQGQRCQVKVLTIDPGAQLSLQRHHHRAEHWVVVNGTALVTRDDQQILVYENQSVYIPVGTVHRLENPGKVPLNIIEVQSGSYLGEDDIVRFEDHYGRS